MIGWEFKINYRLLERGTYASCPLGVKAPLDVVTRTLAEDPNT